MCESGTFDTSSDVCNLVAIENKADVDIRLLC